MRESGGTGRALQTLKRTQNGAEATFIRIHPPRQRTAAVFQFPEVTAQRLQGRFLRLGRATESGETFLGGLCGGKSGLGLHQHARGPISIAGQSYPGI
jgi:hypothetical protein